jgi:Tfp pilus assembly major pilin PilA
MAVLAPLALISYIGVMAAIAIPAYQQYVEKAAQMQDH